MSKPIFDYDGEEFIYKTSDNTAFNSDGDLLVRIGNNAVLDTQTGDLHFTSDWDNDKDD